MILPDANIWIYAADERMPEHRAALRLLSQSSEDSPLLLPAVVQMEVIHYLARTFRSQAATPIQRFLAVQGVREAADEATLLAAVPLLLVHHPAIGTRDAVILAHAKRNGATLLTADKGLAKVARRVGVQTQVL